MYEEALALVSPILDYFHFAHKYGVSTPFLGGFCGGEFLEHSTFDIPGLGKFGYCSFFTNSFVLEEYLNNMRCK